MCLQCNTTFSLKWTEFFCKPLLDTRCTKYKQSEPKHNRISPSGFVPYKVVGEGFWTLLTWHCGFCSSDVHSAYPMLKDIVALLQQYIVAAAGNYSACFCTTWSLVENDQIQSEILKPILGFFKEIWGKKVKKHHYSCQLLFRLKFPVYIMEILPGREEDSSDVKSCSKDISLSVAGKVYVNWGPLKRQLSPGKKTWCMQCDCTKK